MIDFFLLSKGLFLNFLLFFFLASIYNQIQVSAKSLNTLSIKLLAGLSFGVIACLGMAMGIELQPGLKVDGRILIVGLASAYGGIVSGAVSALIVSIFRVFLGGPGVYVGVAGVVGGFLLGLVFYKKFSRKPIPYDWKILILLGLLLTLQAQLMVPLFFPMDVAVKLLKRVFIVGIFFYPLSTMILGLLLNSGMRRRILQSELEESYLHIEKTVKERTEELQNALDEIQTLRGIIPICSHCKVIRNDKGAWVDLERYIEEHSEAEFSHSICDDCLEKFYPE